MLEALEKPVARSRPCSTCPISTRPSRGRMADPSVVLDDISIDLREGEIVGVLGRSGCGKSTLLRIAAGLISPTSGEITFQGTVVDRPAKGIAMVFQTFALFPWLTVLENVMAGLDALGMKEDEASEEGHGGDRHDRP